MPEFTDYAPGTPSWVDLGSPDVDASARFYGELFGWQAFEPGPAEETGGYRIFLKDGKQVAGLGPLQQDGQPPAWTAYIATADADEFPAEVPPFWSVCFAVSDCDDTVARAQALGASVTMPSTTIPAGRFAVLADPQGAAFSVIAM